VWGYIYGAKISLLNICLPCGRVDIWNRRKNIFFFFLTFGGGGANEPAGWVITHSGERELEKPPRRCADGFDLFVNPEGPNGEAPIPVARVAIVPRNFARMR